MFDAAGALDVSIVVDVFADENNLNLMSRRTLLRAAENAAILHFRVGSTRLLGFASNLILVAKKGTTPHARSVIADIKVPTAG
jgi:hypothetical protein